MKNIVITTALVLSLASQAIAADYAHVRKGQTYDYDVVGQFTNPQAVVLDKKNGWVLIEVVEGNRRGEVDWVSPAKLLTPRESRKQEVDNVAVGIGIGVLFYCALTKTCDKGGKTAR